jgi:hypothetical protein
MPEFRATSEIYWISTLVAALIDVVLVFLLAKTVQRDRLRQLAWPLVIASAAFWLALWAWVMQDAFVWETCFQYVFADRARWMMPLLMALLEAAIALGMWWLALRLPGNAAVTFCLLGGLDSFPGHLWAIYGRRLFEACPLLQQVSVASALIFGFFEFVIYWSVILIIAALLKRLGQVVKPT